MTRGGGGFPVQLYYFRNYLNQSDPARDLAKRIQWAAATKRTPPTTTASTAPSYEPPATSPLFLLVFGGLVWAGEASEQVPQGVPPPRTPANAQDYFEFLHEALAHLPPDRFEVIGAQEAARLMRQVARSN